MVAVAVVLTLALAAFIIARIRKPVMPSNAVDSAAAAGEPAGQQPGRAAATGIAEAERMAPGSRLGIVEEAPTFVEPFHPAAHPMERTLSPRSDATLVEETKASPQVGGSGVAAVAGGGSGVAAGSTGSTKLNRAKLAWGAHPSPEIEATSLPPSSRPPRLAKQASGTEGPQGRRSNRVGVEPAAKGAAAAEAEGMKEAQMSPALWWRERN